MHCRVALRLHPAPLVLPFALAPRLSSGRSCSLCPRLPSGHFYLISFPSIHECHHFAGPETRCNDVPLVRFRLYMHIPLFQADRTWLAWAGADVAVSASIDALSADSISHCNNVAAPTLVAGRTWLYLAQPSLPHPHQAHSMHPTDRQSRVPSSGPASHHERGKLHISFFSPPRLHCPLW